jgi:hypothetical protein
MNDRIFDSIFIISVCRKELCSTTFQLVVVLIQVLQMQGSSQPKKPEIEFSRSIMIADPGNRKPIDSYECEIRDQVNGTFTFCYG